MSTTAMVVHTDAAKVSFEVLRALPIPQKLGPRHHPLHHADLLQAVKDEARSRNLEIAEEQYAITAEGRKLFALLTFMNTGLDGMGWSLGIRNSIDQDIAARGVGGSKVFICDNMSLSGDEFLFAHKNTRGLVGRIKEIVSGAFERYLRRMLVFDKRVLELQAAVISDNAARVAIYKAFVEHKVAALRLLPAVDEAYFVHGAEVSNDSPQRKQAVQDAKGQVEVYPEVVKNQWGVHNAFTRVFKGIESPMAQQAATRRLGKVFAL